MSLSNFGFLLGMISWNKSTFFWDVFPMRNLKVISFGAERLASKINISSPEISMGTFGISCFLAGLG